MDRFEYVRLPLALIPDEIIQEYQLHRLAHNGHIYCEIHRGMYGLPQMGILANNLLTQQLTPFGYYQLQHTPGLWQHRW